MRSKVIIKVVPNCHCSFEASESYSVNEPFRAVSSWLACLSSKLVEVFLELLFLPCHFIERLARRYQVMRECGRRCSPCLIPFRSQSFILAVFEPELLIDNVAKPEAAANENAKDGCLQDYQRCDHFNPPGRYLLAGA